VRTFADGLKAPRNNFEVVRLVAAIMIIISHSYPLLGLHFEPFKYYLGGYSTGGDIAVSIFFVVSGFLVTKSATEREILNYLISRVLRILPGLCAVVVFVAFVIGPSFTTLEYPEYMLHREVYAYLKNMLVFGIQFTLPGVFHQLPTNSVNGSLWTLPIEAAFYVLLPFLISLGFVRRWLVLGTIALVMTLLLIGVYVRGAKPRASLTRIRGFRGTWGKKPGRYEIE
jgi:peptidoglycan/LPS O-acetylase OafA/YrhL